MDTPAEVDRGRDLYARGSWHEAWEALYRSDRETTLEPADLERLATAAYLTGRDEESADAWARAHQAYLGRAEVERAVRCAFWLAFGLLQKGERARGGGWISRAVRLLEECGSDCVERGYLFLPDGLKRIGMGDGEGALACFSEAARIGERFGDPDLSALALHSRGRVLIRMGEVDTGVALLDEAMAAVEARELSPLVVGDVYCSVIEGCVEIFDLGRAREWTAALTHWCESQPGLVPYRGQCLVRRAEIMQLHGEWPAALDEVERACEFLARPPGEPAAGSAYYQRAELCRLRGEFAEAEEAYKEASRWGRKPQPGLARLRLAKGDGESASASLRRALDEGKDRHVRARLLPAYVETMLATGHLADARTAAEELGRIADVLDQPLLRATADQAEGAVLLAEGDPRAALSKLRAALSGWQEIGAPYEAARTRVLMGRACRELGDRDGGEVELEAARRAFRDLGAAPDVARVEALTRSDTTGPERGPRPGGLTPRELEILRHVAAGKTNRAIARELFISEKTVARHVSNIFLKLGLSTRSAATAWAYEHDVV